MCLMQLPPQALWVLILQTNHFEYNHGPTHLHTMKRFDTLINDVRPNELSHLLQPIVSRRSLVPL